MIQGYEDTWIQKTRIQGYKDIRIQGYKDTRIQGYKDTRIQGNKDTRIQGYKDTRIQGYKDTRIQWVHMNLYESEHISRMTLLITQLWCSLRYHLPRSVDIQDCLNNNQTLNCLIVMYLEIYLEISLIQNKKATKEIIKRKWLSLNYYSKVYLLMQVLFNLTLFPALEVHVSTTAK